MPLGVNIRHDVISRQGRPCEGNLVVELTFSNICTFSSFAKTMHSNQIPFGFRMQLNFLASNHITITDLHRKLCKVQIMLNPTFLQNGHPGKKRASHHSYLFHVLLWNWRKLCRQRPARQRADPAKGKRTIIAKKTLGVNIRQDVSSRQGRPGEGNLVAAITFSKIYAFSRITKIMHSNQIAFGFQMQLHFLASGHNIITNSHRKLSKV